MEVKNTIQRGSIFLENAFGQNPNKKELAKEKSGTTKQQLFVPLVLSAFGKCTTSLPRLHFFTGSVVFVF